jgi:sugar/nucleoside kinase (ribokinase family)
VARLGAGALFISAIGKDDLGDQFVSLLQGRGSQTACLLRCFSNAAAMVQQHGACHVRSVASCHSLLSSHASQCSPHL